MLMTHPALPHFVQSDVLKNDNLRAVVMLTMAVFFIIKLSTGNKHSVEKKNFSHFLNICIHCIQWEAILIQCLFLICSWMWCLLICVYMTGIPSPLSFLITNSEQQNHNPAYLNSNDSDSHLSLISCFLGKEWRCTFSHIFCTWTEATELYSCSVAYSKQDKPSFT